ncbi:MAG: TetR/AcrR family transcriptional regulator [gamma proteobacterium symbiont of Taylorina sp.]|nr:TetR/AcrR family transcriptional regulator [gamma proteobacterium symbiont of Taylorina sp.]
MARVKEFDEVKALEKAMHLFWNHGYDGTSLQMLEKAMGLVRSSIYNTYGNKRKLFNTVISHYEKTVITQLMMSVEKESDIRKSMSKMLNGEINLHFNKNNPGGCLIVLSVLEKAQHGDESTKLLESIVKKMEKFLTKKISEAQNEEQISTAVDVKSVSLAIATTVVGIAVMGKAGFSKSALQNMVATTISLLDAS